MSIYKKRIILFLTLVGFSILCSCVNQLSVPESTFRSSNELSLVYGKFEAVYNNGAQLIPLTIEGSGRLQQHFELGFDPFTFTLRTDWFSTNGYRFPKYTVVVERPDGYFSAALPPGKYVIYSIVWVPPQLKFSKSDWESPFTNTSFKILYPHRKYIPEGFSFLNGNPKMATFFVRSGRDNYIGTIYFEARNFIPCTTRVEISRSPIAGGWEVLYRNVPAKCFGINGINVLDKYDEAKMIFQTLYPNSSGLVKSLVDLDEGIPK